MCHVHLRMYRKLQLLKPRSSLQFKKDFKSSYQSYIFSHEVQNQNWLQECSFIHLNHDMCSVINTMKTKNMDLLALSKVSLVWLGVSTTHGITILHSGTSSPHINGVAALLSPRARAAWEATGSVFQPASERMIKIRLLEWHLSYMTVLSVYAPTNPSTSTSCSF